jgi:hypothetical protein
MRTIFFLLLLANATLFAYTRLDSGGSGDAVRLTQQVRPEMIKLLTPQQVAALGPAKVAALADVCIEWGPFNDAERARVASEIETLKLGRLLSQKRIETTTTHWVYVPRLPSKADADKRVADLTGAGVKNVSVIDAGPQRLFISLGAFRSEEAAKAYLQKLEQMHVADAKVGPRQQTQTQTVLVVRDPEAAVVSRLKTMKSDYPDTELKIGGCEKTS